MRYALKYPVLLMEISGEDINSPRQSFICKAPDDPAFSNLADSTWR